MEDDSDDDYKRNKRDEGEDRNFVSFSNPESSRSPFRRADSFRNFAFDRTVGSTALRRLTSIIEWLTGVSSPPSLPLLLLASTSPPIAFFSLIRFPSSHHPSLFQSTIFTSSSSIASTGSRTNPRMRRSTKPTTLVDSFPSKLSPTLTVPRSPTGTESSSTSTRRASWLRSVFHPIRSRFLPFSPLDSRCVRLTLVSMLFLFLLHLGVPKVPRPGGCSG